MKYLVFIALCLGAVHATSFTDCGSEASDVLLEVEGCIDPPCVVSRNETYIANITFTEDHVITELTVRITAVIGGLNVPWPGLDNNACNHLTDGQTCPIDAFVPTTWEYHANVTHTFPVTSTVATFKLTDQEDHTNVCVQFNVTIV